MSRGAQARGAIAFLSLFGTVVSAAVIGFHIADPVRGALAGPVLIYTAALAICGMTFTHTIVRMAIAGEIGVRPGLPVVRPLVLNVLTLVAVTLVAALVVNAVISCAGQRAVPPESR